MKTPTGTGSADAAAYPFKAGFPTPEATRQARDEADLQRAITAYRFWYPSVSMEGIFEGNRAVGIEDNAAWGIAAGPRQVGFTLNSDTPYGSAVIDVSAGPMVIELPAGPFIGLVDDHHQGWVLDMGMPGPDAGRGGKHKPFAPTARLRDILTRAARAGRDQLLVSAFDSARPDRLNWPDRWRSTSAPPRPPAAKTAGSRPRPAAAGSPTSASTDRRRRPSTAAGNPAISNRCADTPALSPVRRRPFRGEAHGQENRRKKTPRQTRIR